MAIVRAQRSAIEMLLLLQSSDSRTVQSALLSGQELLPLELRGISEGDGIYNRSGIPVAVFLLLPAGSEIKTVQIKPGQSCCLDEPVVGGARSTERTVTSLDTISRPDGSTVLQKSGPSVTYYATV